MSTQELLQLLLALNQDLDQTPLTAADRRKYKGRWNKDMLSMGEAAADFRETLDDRLGAVSYSGHDIRRALNAVKDADRTEDLIKVFGKAAADTKIARRSQAYAMIMGILYAIQAQLVDPFLDDHNRTRLTLAMRTLRQGLDRRNRKIGRALSAARGPGKRYRMRFLGVALDWPKGGPALPQDRARGLTFSPMACGHWPVSPGHLARQALSPRISQALLAPISEPPGQALQAVPQEPGVTLGPPIWPARPTRQDASGPRSLRELREERGLTQVALAGAAGLTQAMLSRTETRDDHLLSTLRKYAAALGATLEVALVFPSGRRITLRSAR